MKLAFTLLLVTTSLGAGSVVLAAGQGLSLTPGASLHHSPSPGGALTLIDDDRDEDGGWFWQQVGDDDEDEDEDEDCEDDDDEDDCLAGTAGNAAKVGTVAPPKNGLFTNGTAPVVTSN